MAEKKVMIVTGGNSGLGLETAKSLCGLGHHVIISVRDHDKGTAAMSHIKSAVPTADIAYSIMELSDPQSIRDFVTSFLAKEKPLHVLMNNAGMFMPLRNPERRTARKDPELELTMTTNCMGHFLLTNLLLDKLKASGTEADPARIINVSSGITVEKMGVNQGGFFIDDIMLAEEGHYWTGLQSYRNSKLAIHLWTKELAKKLKGCNVVVNTVCPGFIPATALSRENRATYRGMFLLTIANSFIGRWLFSAEPVEAGRDKLLQMAVSEDRKTSGIFYTQFQPRTEAAEVLDEDNQMKIWDLCVKYSTL
ncbi:retinol dehydrogenase 11-like [Watersipora subatra]|uniref:retinol dehydrogenase 11-like n=1 Tax=Watersipora subatra TaxID=2589382 RepID=UPI00355C13B4